MARRLRDMDERIDILKDYVNDEICTASGFSHTLQAAWKAEARGQLFGTTNMLGFLDDIGYKATGRIVGFDPDNPCRKSSKVVIELSDEQFQALLVNKKRKDF